MNSISSIIHFKYKNGNLPVIYLTDDKVIPLLPLYYILYLKDHKDLSYTKIYKVARSISLLYDYHRVHLKNKELDEYETKTLITGFIKERSRANILGWESVQKRTIQQDFYNLRDFSSWCVNNFNVLDFGYQENTFKGMVKEAFKDYIAKNTKLLYHLQKNKSQSDLGFFNFSFPTNKVPKAFPYDRIQELIDKTPSSRDKLILLLLAFGGKRISEVTHLFLQDLIPYEGKLRVRMAHPEHSHFEWSENNKVIKGTREQYLKQTFNMVPRNQQDKDKYFVGWKGMKFDDEALGMSELYFICNVEKYLYKLHQDYFNQVRRHYNHHPYYFVNSKNGEPMTLKAMANVFYRACERIGITDFSSHSGLTPHSLRHFYGFYCVDILKLDLMVVQKYLGHVSLLSTQVYANISKKTAHKILTDANSNNKIDFSSKGESDV